MTSAVEGKVGKETLLSVNLFYSKLPGKLVVEDGRTGH